MRNKTSQRLAAAVLATILATGCAAYARPASAESVQRDITFDSHEQYYLMFWTDYELYATGEADRTEEVDDATITFTAPVYDTNRLTDFDPRLTNEAIKSRSLIGVATLGGGNITWKSKGDFSLTGNLNINYVTDPDQLYDSNGNPYYSALAAADNGTFTLQSGGKNTFTLYDAYDSSYASQDPYSQTAPVFSILSGGDVLSIEGTANTLAYVENEDWTTFNQATYGMPYGYDTRVDPLQVALVYSESGAPITIHATTGDNVVYGGKASSGGVIGLSAMPGSSAASSGGITMTSDNGSNAVTLSLDSFYGNTYTNALYAGTYAATETSETDPISSVTLNAARDNTVTARTGEGATMTNGVWADAQGAVSLMSTGGDNVVTVGSYGRYNTLGVASSYGGTVTMTAQTGNNRIVVEPMTMAGVLPEMGDSYHPTLAGAYAVNDGEISFSAPNGTNSVSIVPTAEVQNSGSAVPETASYTGIYGMHSGKVAFSGAVNQVQVDTSQVASLADVQGTAVLAQSGSEVTLDATQENNVYGTTEALHAANGSITVTSDGSNTIFAGTTAILAENPDGDTASTVTVNGPVTVSTESQEDPAVYAKGGNQASISAVAINYAGTSQITGTLKATGDGTVTVAPRSDAGTVTVAGNVEAYGDTTTTTESDGGTVELTLSDGSVLSGTTDTGTVYNRVYSASAEIGTVNLTLDGSSQWIMPSSSSVTTLSGTGSVYYRNGGDALEITNLEGSHTFSLDLDYSDPSNSDMIYIVNGTSDVQTLSVKNLGTLSSQMDVGDRVRFATVLNSENEFVDGRVYSAALGVRNEDYTVRYVSYASDPLNETTNYNGSATNTRKPDTATVASTYGGENVYLEKTRSTINAGGLAPDYARDLVWRYVTMPDTYTNRTGESRPFTEGTTDGGWARVLYRNLDVSDTGKLDGATYELGYSALLNDSKEDQHRVGASFSYGKEDGRWDGFGGYLDVKDIALALYDTHEYTGKEGQRSYWDTVFKAHRVRNEYGARDSETNILYKGDYDQDVYSLSTEYGRDYALGRGWSIVPQVQLQAAYLDGYDYTDSQQIHVSADSAWSLLGRAGFDLVRKMGTRYDQKFYVKANVYREFLDGQDLTMTNSSLTPYYNDGDQKGTWGAFGLGYSSKVGKDQYFYVDVDRLVGHSYDNTYYVRAGLNWKF